MTAVHQLHGITREGRPMTRVRADQILSEAKDFDAVESPRLLPPPNFPAAIMSIIGPVVTVCAWHEGGRGKLEAERWAAAQGYAKINHGSCAKCAAAVKAGTWEKA